MSALSDLFRDLIRDHAAKIVTGIFSLLLIVFPAIGSRVEALKQPTADYVSALVNVIMPKEQQIGVVDLADGGALLVQEKVADKIEAKQDAIDAKAEAARVE